MTFTFNEDKHEYSLNDRRIPSVTQIIGEFIPTFKATDWHMNRGKAVHACAELIANGVQFECDPQIQGRVDAIYKFFREVKPVVMLTEKKVYSTVYQFAGKLDLYCIIDGKKYLLDWKSTLCPEMVALQCAGYSLTAQIKPLNVNYCIGVQMNDDGTYKISNPIDMRPYRNEFLAMRTVYGIKQRMKLIKSKQPTEETP